MVLPYRRTPLVWGRRGAAASHRLRYDVCMEKFPIKVCAVCGDEFELKPGKPGFANRCPDCSDPDADAENGKGVLDADPEANAERRRAMRNLLYRKDE